MASINKTPQHPAVLTHEGARAARISPIQQLRRTVMACMLWEDGFYESGQEVAERMQDEVKAVLKTPNGADIVANIAYEARTKFKLRHAPLMLALAIVESRMPEASPVVAGLLESIIQRADEMAEFVALYWRNGKRPLSAQVKRGLAAAFQKFDRYGLAKYATREGAVRLRDVLFMVHPKPKHDDQAALWKELAEDTIKAPDTWESQLSAGSDKKGVFTSLIQEKKLGALAMLRNLRNMQQSGVSEDVIRKGLVEMKTERVLPFRFITAARYAPQFEPELEQAMFKCIEDMAKLPGKTALLIDHSGSMQEKLSAKSEITRWEAAAALAILMRELCESCSICVYSTSIKGVAPRRGFALRDLMTLSMGWGGTMTGLAISELNGYAYDRIIVFTDEQSHDAIPNPRPGSKAYFINIASNRNGIGYGAWTHIDGFSEAVIDYIQQFEAQE